MATQAGVLLGTAAYMSPEQAKGKAVDRRADIWAFGCVLYEMLTGKRTFDGETITDTLAAIVRAEPDWSQLPAETPIRIRVLLQRCLQKDPKQRLRDIGDARISIDEVLSGAPDPTLVGAPQAAMKTTWKILPWAAAVAAILAAILVAGGALLLTRRENPAPLFRNVTFREGTLQNARFSHDGQTIIYSGTWENEPPQVSIARVGSPESRPLGIPSGAIAAASSSDALAVFQGCEQFFIINCGGMLATVSLAGGAPRDVAEHVAYADWSPDGSQLVISPLPAKGARLEFPPGHVLYEQKAGWLADPRFSPDGSQIAFANHPTTDTDEGAVEVMDLNGKRTTLADKLNSIEGLAWSPDGKEIWFAATRNGGWAGTIYAVTLSGKLRTVLTLPGVRLHDISRDGRVLLSQQTWRVQLMGLFPGDTVEHPYSWFDGPVATGISSDGRAITFKEEGAVFYLENDALAYYRPTNGSPAVRLGAGQAAISPDGKWALTWSRESRKMQFQPIGAGEAKPLPTPGLIDFDQLVWSDDGRQVAYEAQTDQKDWNVYTQKIEVGMPVLVQAGVRHAGPILSPDGAMLALRKNQGGISLYRIGGDEPVAVKGVLDSEYLIRFANGGKSLLVFQATGSELVLTLVELSTGRRQPWKRISTGTDPYDPPKVTPDLKYYVYPLPRNSTVLYTVDNLR